MQTQNTITRQERRKAERSAAKQAKKLKDTIPMEAICIEGNPNDFIQKYEKAKAEEIQEARAKMKASPDKMIRGVASHFADESISELIFNTKQWTIALNQTLALNANKNEVEITKLWMESALKQCDDHGMKMMLYASTALIGKGTYEAALNFIKINKK